MVPYQRTTPYGGAFARRFTRYQGIYYDEFGPDSAWIRDEASITLPPLETTATLVVSGVFRTHPQVRGLERGLPWLELTLDGQRVARVAAPADGPWSATVALPPTMATRGAVLGFRLRGAALTNALAWLGRVTGWGPWQRFRAQHRNRQLRIGAIAAADGERIYDFSRREAPYSATFAQAHSRIGMNVVGFLTADLGIGESARCMVRAADAARLPVALVPLKLNCRNRLGDPTFEHRLADENPHGVNVFHLDPPVARDVDHHHGPTFRRGHYNIGFFAWELPEFPDAWTAAFDYFDEVWCPSSFVTEAVALKAPIPVLTMPHAIGFERPTAAPAELRARFGLPTRPFLFLCLFDLNSYSARKNPRAVVEAFRRSGLAGPDAALVIKVHNADANPSDFAALQQAVADLPGTVIVNGTLSRTDVYALEAACDCYVSLHRSEGFGLAVAECMYLGKPVIATDWSATAEYLNHDNGYPVPYTLVPLTENHGPYTKGSIWAEPSVDAAAARMRAVCADPAAAAAAGARARQTIEERFAPAAVGARYRRRLAAIAGL